MTAPARPASGPPTVFLHIGTMKTGTSFLQTVLRRNAPRLAADGIYYPLGDGSRWTLQLSAARDILGIKGRPTDGAWDAMVADIRRWDGRAALVSMEFYSLASAGRVARIVAGLAPAQVQVILTARDLARVLPSAWQSMVKQGHPWSFPEFTASVVGDAGDESAHRRFWRHHDLPAIAGRWAKAVGAANVHLVTVPPAGAPASALWERFCSVIGVAPDRYDVSQDRHSNFSLSYSDAELVRQVNLALGGGVGRLAQKRWATGFLANRVLRAGSGERTADDRPGLDPAAHAWALQRSREMAVALDDLGVHVVGDLADLVPGPHPGLARTGPVTAYPSNAARIIAALVRRIAEVDPKLATLEAADELQDPDDAADLDDAREAVEARTAPSPRPAADISAEEVRVP